MERTRIAGAVDDAVNALQAAILLAAHIEADQQALRHAIDRAARALAELARPADSPASDS